MCESCDGGMNRRSFLISSSARARPRWCRAASCGRVPRNRVLGRARNVRFACWSPFSIRRPTWSTRARWRTPGASQLVHLAGQPVPARGSRSAKFTAKIREMAETLGHRRRVPPAGDLPGGQGQGVHRRDQGGRRRRRADRQLLEHAFQCARCRWRPRRPRRRIVYHSLGSNHQLPPEACARPRASTTSTRSRTSSEIERGLRAVRADEDAGPEPAAAHLGPGEGSGRSPRNPT